MPIGKKANSTATLEALQTIVDQTEPGIGPLDAIESLSENGKDFTLLTFDDDMTLDAPATTLLLATDPAPARKLLFLQGQGFVGGAPAMLAAHVPGDRVFRVRRLVACFLSMGWSGHAAIGIAANIQAESAFDPAGTGDGGTAYGLAQWRGDRQATFEKILRRPLKGSTFREQLAFIDWELTHTHSTAGAALKQAPTSEDAAEVVCRKYELPKDPDGESANRRLIATQLQPIAFV